MELLDAIAKAINAQSDAKRERERERERENKGPVDRLKTVGVVERTRASVYRADFKHDKTLVKSNVTYQNDGQSMPFTERQKRS